MQKLKCLIVDDETKSRLVTRSWLERYFPEVSIAGEAADVETAYEIIQAEHPDLVFLDIQMPRGDGFSLLRKFDEVPFEVIFVTSFNQFAISAIKFNALDYLLKPLEIDDLRFALEKAAKRIRTRQSNSGRIGSLLDNLQVESQMRKVQVHTSNSVVIIDPKEIVSIHASGNYSSIHVTDGSEYVTSRTLRDFEDFFGESSQLLRVTKSAMINASMIRRYSKGDPFIIELTNGESHEVARRRKAAILSRIQK
jgi:two-component system, LytTR family, response regulator